MNKTKNRNGETKMTKTQTHKKGQEVEVDVSMQAFADESKNYSGMNVHKVINFETEQVLVYSGSHDGEIGIMQFVFADNEANRNSFEYDSREFEGRNITIQIDNPVVAEHKSYFGQSRKAEVDFRKVNACKTASDLIDYLMTCDFMDYGFSDKCWGGFDYDFTTSIK